MKHLNNMLFGFIAAGTVAMYCNTATIQVYAQSAETDNTTDILLISELPEISPGEGPHHGPWPERLGLSDEQMEQLVSLKEEHMIDTAKDKAELRADKQKLMLLMTAPKVDKQAVLSLNEKVNQLESSLSKARVEHMLSVMDILTPKQKEEMRHHMLVHALSHHHACGKSHKLSSHKQHHSA